MPQCFGKFVCTDVAVYICANLPLSLNYDNQLVFWMRVTTLCRNQHLLRIAWHSVRLSGPYMFNGHFCFCSVREKATPMTTHSQLLILFVGLSSLLIHNVVGDCTQPGGICCNVCGNHEGAGKIVSPNHEFQMSSSISWTCGAWQEEHADLNER